MPITRNVSGSAFLRLQGVACRHGRITIQPRPRDLIGDCDVIVNFALSNTAIPRIDRDINRQITRNVVQRLNLACRSSSPAPSWFMPQQ